MSERIRKHLVDWADAGDPVDVEQLRRHFGPRVERNKTRRGKDDEPPAALPAPVEPRPRGGGPSGGAAAATTLEVHS